MDEVVKFVLKNGFKETGLYHFANDNCQVEIVDNSNEQYYVISDKQGNTMFTDNVNIYQLIGILTYYNLMDKNYKTDIKEIGFE